MYLCARYVYAGKIHGRSLLLNLTSEKLLREMRINNMFRSHDTCNMKGLRTSVNACLKTFKNTPQVRLKGQCSRYVYCNLIGGLHHFVNEN